MKLAEKPGFVLPLLAFVLRLATWQVVAHTVPAKGRASLPDFTHLHTFAGIPELLLRKEQDTSNKQIKDFLGGHEMGPLEDKSFVRITPKVARVGKAGQCQSPLPYYY